MTSVYEFAPFTLDPAERRLLRGDTPVPLTPKAFDLLVALVARHGHLITKQELLDTVWAGAFVEESSLTFHISALRKALGNGQDGTRYIETVPTRGYRFVASVTEARDEPVPEEAPTADIEGETLAARLARGRLPLALALQYATQIAEALDAAHRQGRVHGDLTPAKVMLTRPAGVTLLDAGLPPHGIATGTLPYMAPEQVRGEEADARSDLFAFGAVLYEMLAGRRPFDADSPTALRAQILESEPPPLAERAPHVPAALDRLIQTCLAKDPADRWQYAHDVVLALRGIGERENDVPERVPSPSPRVSRWQWAALGAGATAAAIAIVAWDGRPPTPREGAPRVLAAMPLPVGFLPGTFKGFIGQSQPAISPDGRRVAIIGRWGGRPQVWIRPMDAPTVTPVPGTEDADVVFWAPDSQRIGFISRGTLRTVAVSGGPVQTLWDGLSAHTMGGTWGSQGVIVFDDEGRLYRIPERGGTPAPLVLGDRAADDVRHSQASFLPDGRRFIFVAEGRDTYHIGLGSLDGADVVPLVEDDGAHAPHYAAGHVLFVRRGELLAMPFDVRTAAATGPPRTLAEWNAWGYTSTAAGTVVAMPTEGLTKELGFRMPDGVRGATLGPSGPYTQLALSASGARAAVVKLNAEKRPEMWWVNLATSAWTRLEPRVGGGNEPTEMLDPAWGPDDRRLAFSAHGRGFIRDISTGADELIADLPMYIDDWTSDGSMVLFRGQRAVWGALPGAADTPRELFRVQHMRDQLQVSPDGGWIAYNALDSDAWEVYIARFPSFTDVQQVSASRSGVQPTWAHDGHRLFYLMFDGTMMAVDLRRDGEALVAAAPRALFATRLTNPSPMVSEYDVAKDGRFLIMERAPGPYTLTVLMNWAPEGL